MDISVHYALLVTALYLLNQVSVTGKDVDTAGHYLKDFCRLFPSFYGKAHSDVVVLRFNATLTANVISWWSVTHMCSLAFSHQH